MKKLTVGGLFSGIGGFELGLQRAGFEIRWMVEIDEFCNRVLEKHWPHVKRYGDVHEVGVHNLEPVDVICGGDPCQPVSVAGKQRGKEDHRWLWPEMFRVIRKLKPRWVVGENVAGLIRMGLDDCLSDLEGEGYTCQTFIIPACAVNAPHRRDRVWIVAYSERFGRRRWNNGDERRMRRQVQAQGPSTAYKQEDVADTESQQRERDMGGPATRGERPTDGSKKLNKIKPHRKRCVPAQTISDAQGVGLQGVGTKGEQEPEAFRGQGISNGYGSIGDIWTTEPDVGRVAHGIPRRVDRLKALGNAVVPQIPELIGRAIKEASNEQAK